MRVELLGLLVLLVVAFFLGSILHPTHNCPVTVEYVASDTVPPVQEAWIIAQETVQRRVVTRLVLEIPAPAGMVAIQTISDAAGHHFYYDSLGEHITDSSIIFRPRQADSFSLNDPFSTAISGVFTDSLLAYQELCRRWEAAETALKAQADSLARKRQGCEDPVVKAGVR